MVQVHNIVELSQRKSKQGLKPAVFLFFSLLHQTNDIHGNIINYYVVTNLDAPIEYKCFSNPPGFVLFLSFSLNMSERFPKDNENT